MFPWDPGCSKSIFLCVVLFQQHILETVLLLSSYCLTGFENEEEAMSWIVWMFEVADFVKTLHEKLYKQKLLSLFRNAIVLISLREIQPVSLGECEGWNSCNTVCLEMWATQGPLKTPTAQEWFYLFALIGLMLPNELVNDSSALKHLRGQVQAEVKGWVHNGLEIEQLIFNGKKT